MQICGELSGSSAFVNKRRGAMMVMEFEGYLDTVSCNAVELVRCDFSLDCAVKVIRRQSKMNDKVLDEDDLDVRKQLILKFKLYKMVQREKKLFIFE